MADALKVSYDRTLEIWESLADLVARRLVERGHFTLEGFGRFEFTSSGKPEFRQSTELKQVVREAQPGRYIGLKKHSRKMEQYLKKLERDRAARENAKDADAAFASIPTLESVANQYMNSSELPADTRRLLPDRKAGAESKAAPSRAGDGSETKPGRPAVGASEKHVRRQPSRDQVRAPAFSAPILLPRVKLKAAAPGESTDERIRHLASYLAGIELTDEEINRLVKVVSVRGKPRVIQCLEYFIKMDFDFRLIEEKLRADGVESAPEDLRNVVWNELLWRVSSECQDQRSNFHRYLAYPGLNPATTTADGRITRR